MYRTGIMAKYTAMSNEAQLTKKKSESILFGYYQRKIDGVC